MWEFDEVMVWVGVCVDVCVNVEEMMMMMVGVSFDEKFEAVRADAVKKR